MNAILQTLEQHKTALAVAACWAVREWKGVVWPGLRQAWPFLKENGGARGVIKTFLSGTTAGTTQSTK